MVFAPGADVSWVGGAPVVSLEVHDRLAASFGLEVREDALLWFC